MSDNITFFHSKGDKKLDLDHPEDFLRWQSKIPKGEKWKSKWSKVGEERTLKQNNLYWGIIDRIVDLENDVDITKNKLHVYFAYTYLSHPTNVFDVEITEIESTTDLSKKKFIVYIEKIINWCIQKHGIIPIDDTWRPVWNEIKK